MSTSGKKDIYDGSVNRSKEEPFQSERLAFTGRIAASIAHEIRNPLGNVSVAVQQLRDAFTGDSPWDQTYRGDHQKYGEDQLFDYRTPQLCPATKTQYPLS